MSDAMDEMRNAAWVHLRHPVTGDAPDDDAIEAAIAAALAAAPTVGVYLCEKRTKENHGKAFLTHVLHKHRTKDGSICPGPHRILLIKPEVKL
jgi:hypothetical protein